MWQHVIWRGVKGYAVKNALRRDRDRRDEARREDRRAAILLTDEVPTTKPDPITVGSNLKEMLETRSTKDEENRHHPLRTSSRPPRARVTSRQPRSSAIFWRTKRSTTIPSRRSSRKLISRRPYHDPAEAGARCSCGNVVEVLTPGGGELICCRRWRGATEGEGR